MSTSWSQASPVGTHELLGLAFQSSHPRPLGDRMRHHLPTTGAKEVRA